MTARGRGTGSGGMRVRRSATTKYAPTPWIRVSMYLVFMYYNCCYVTVLFSVFTEIEFHNNSQYCIQCVGENCWQNVNCNVL